MVFDGTVSQTDRVWYYFSELSKIPRGSGNTKRVSDYCVSFAREHGLYVRQDEWNNVIIKKKGSPGRENQKGVILQGHLDMVTEKTKDSRHDFTKDPLKLRREGDFLFAEDTTLGGDDGIAIAYSLALLEDEHLSHPPLEAVFTVDEEIGLLGAAALDLYDLEGSYLLNIDSEEEGMILTGCAGGMTSICSIPLPIERRKGVILEVEISGLQGGHSGTEIQKEHCNGAKLFGRLLAAWLATEKVYLIEAAIGQKDNAIPRMGTARILAEPEAVDSLVRTAEELQEQARKEYYRADPDLTVVVKEPEGDPAVGLRGAEDHEVITLEGTKKAAAFLCLAPNGVFHWHPTIPGLVETSLNLGIFSVEGGNLTGSFSVRSSVESRKMELGEQIRLLTELLGGSYEEKGCYPGWEYKEQSALRSLMVEIFEEKYGRLPGIQTIHAGLECGYWSEKRPELDIVSFGPNIYDIHTTEEKLSISSAERVYDYIVEILKRID